MKYSVEQVPEGSQSNCIPLVFEHFGSWGSAAETFFDDLSKRSKDAEGSKITAEFNKKSLRRRILQRCNVRVILKNSKDSCGQIDVDNLFHLDINF